MDLTLNFSRRERERERNDYCLHITMGTALHKYWLALRFSSFCLFFPFYVPLTSVFILSLSVCLFSSSLSHSLFLKINRMIAVFCMKMKSLVLSIQSFVNQDFPTNRLYLMTLKQFFSKHSLFWKDNWFKENFITEKKILKQKYTKNLKWKDFLLKNEFQTIWDK